MIKSTLTQIKSEIDHKKEGKIKVTFNYVSGNTQKQLNGVKSSQNLNTTPYFPQIPKTPPSNYKLSSQWFSSFNLTYESNSEK